MLAFRILTTLLIHDGLLVKGKNFINDRRIGSVIQTINVFQQREIDEMIIVDIDHRMNCEFIDSLTENCFMPLGFGGGIKSIEDVKKFLNHGADKVIIGSNFSEKLIDEISKELGSQSITVSIDYAGNDIYINSGSTYLTSNILDYAKRIEGSGAGEIILSSIEREGTLQGCDIALAEKVCKSVNIPVIISGGAKDWNDFYNAYNIGVSGVSAGALYQFTQETPKKIKQKLKENNVPIR